MLFTCPTCQRIHNLDSHNWFRNPHGTVFQAPWDIFPIRGEAIQTYATICRQCGTAHATTSDAARAFFPLGIFPKEILFSMNLERFVAFVRENPERISISFLHFLARTGLIPSLPTPKVPIFDAPETEFADAAQSALAAFAAFCQMRERPTALHANLFQFIRQAGMLKNSDQTHFTDAQFGHVLASDFLLETIMNGAPVNRFLAGARNML